MVPCNIYLRPIAVFLGYNRLLTLHMYLPIYFIYTWINVSNFPCIFIGFSIVLVYYAYSIITFWILSVNIFLLLNSENLYFQLTSVIHYVKFCFVLELVSCSFCFVLFLKEFQGSHKKCSDKYDSRNKPCP